MQKEDNKSKVQQLLKTQTLAIDEAVSPMPWSQLTESEAKIISRVVHSTTSEYQDLIANVSNRSRPLIKTPRRSFEKSPPPQDFAIDNEGAPVMLLTSKNFVTIPKQTTRAIEVNVPVNPASFINVQPLDDELLDGALPVVYRHKTQQKDKPLVIVYVNLSDKDVIISPNQLIAHGSMISENKTKPIINVLNKGVKDPAVTDRIWAELKLNENKILQENVTVRNMVYSMIN